MTEHTNLDAYTKVAGEDGIDTDGIDFSDLDTTEWDYDAVGSQGGEPDHDNLGSPASDTAGESKDESQ